MATLSISTHFPWGERTGFISKIWAGLIANKLVTNKDFDFYDIECYKRKFPAGLFPMGLKGIVPKIHTIREDSHDLWKPGKKIHMAVFNRTKNRFQFTPVLECKSVQRITIAHINRTHIVHIGDDCILPISDYAICGGIIPLKLKKLVRNDGFNSVEDFFRFFNKDFSGKIINWTEHKY